MCTYTYIRYTVTSSHVRCDVTKPTCNTLKEAAFVGWLSLRMGGTQSVEVPGGGSEGYHVLKVRELAVGGPGMLFHRQERGCYL